MEMIPVRARGGKWTVAGYNEHQHRWAVNREHGVAFGRTPSDAVDWAYADGSRPSDLFATKRGAMAYIEEEMIYAQS